MILIRLPYQRRRDVAPFLAPSDVRLPPAFRGPCVCAREVVIPVGTTSLAPVACRGCGTRWFEGKLGPRVVSSETTTSVSSL